MAPPRPPNSTSTIMQTAFREAATTLNQSGANGAAQLRGIFSRAETELAGGPVRDAVVNFTNALNTRVDGITPNRTSIANTFSALVSALPPDLSATLSNDINTLATKMTTQNVSERVNLNQPNPNNQPLPPTPVTNTVTNAPTNHTPKQAAEEERRKQESQRLQEFHDAVANHFHATSRKRFIHEQDEKFTTESGIESGIEIKSDVKLRDGRYRVQDPNSKGERDSWLIVRNGMVTLSDPTTKENIGNAMDLMRSNGVLDITINFKSPGPYSMGILLDALKEAKSRPGMTVTLGENLLNYLKGTTHQQDKIVRANISNKDQKRIEELLDADPAMRKQFDAWILDKGKMGDSQRAIMQLEFYVEHQNAKAAKPAIMNESTNVREAMNLPSYQQSVNYRGRAKSLEGTSKLTTPNDASAVKTQMFGEDYIGKSASQKLGEVEKQMTVVQERLTRLDSELGRLDKQMKAEAGENFLLSKDSNHMTKLLDHVRIVHDQRERLIEQISHERSDLVTRAQACAKELTDLRTNAGFTPNSPDMNKLTELEQKQTAWNAPDGIANKTETGLQKVQEASKTLHPDMVKDEVVQQKKTEGQRFTPGNV